MSLIEGEGGSEADWDRVLSISLKTMFLASKSAVPVMATKGAGAIVNIGSISGSRGGNSEDP